MSILHPSPVGINPAPEVPELIARISLAQSILAHRELSPTMRRETLAALAGYTIEQIVNREYPGGDA